MDSSVAPKYETWFLRVCYHISIGLYTFNERVVGPQGRSGRFGIVVTNMPCEVGPCHQGMARPQIADGGTASDMEGSCE